MIGEASICRMESERVEIAGMSEQLRAESLQASLTVADLERSAAWYVDVLGFVVEQRHERNETLIAVTLRAGAVQILLTRDDGAKGLERKKGEGMSLQVTTTQDADSLATAIKARGGTLDTEPITAPHGARVFRLRDPDGFRLTISAVPQPHQR